MKEFVEKLIKLLKDEHRDYRMRWKYKGENEEDWQCMKAMQKVIGIVEQLAEEHNNGWISVEDALPEQWQDVYISGEFVDSVKRQSYKAVFGEAEQKECFYGYYCEGKFYGLTEEDVFWVIDAKYWQPLPPAPKKGE